MPKRLVVKSARPGRMIKGKFVPNPKRRNISEGFYAGGVFHPIRSAADYDPSRAGEGGGKKRKRKVAAKAERKPAKKKAAKPARKSKAKQARRKKGKR
jgi:hypothetical protein